MTRTALSPVLFALLAVSLTACGGAPSGSAAGPGGGFDTNVGAQLTQLQKDYASGAISETEFEQRRVAIMNGSSG